MGISPKRSRHRQRRPEVRLVAYQNAVEVGRRDADNRKRRSIQNQRSPYRSALPAKLLLPEGMTDYNRRMLTRHTIFLGKKIAPEHRCYSHHPEEIPRDQLSACLPALSAVAPTCNKRVAIERQHAREPLVVLAVIDISR